MARPTIPPDESTFVGKVAGEIRRRRLELFASVEDAAAKAKVPAPSWYRWEQGAVPLAKLPEIARALGCRPRDLLPE